MKENDIPDLRANGTAERDELLAAEHKLSDAYLRLRKKLAAFDTPTGPTPEQVYAHTEAKLDAIVNRCNELAEQVRLLALAEARAKTMQVTIDLQQKVIFDIRTQRDELMVAAQLVIARWHSPLWKDLPHTGTYIHTLEQAVAKVKP